MSQTLGFVPSRSDSIALPSLQFPLLLTLCAVKTQALERETGDLQNERMHMCAYICLYIVINIY